jgi:paraquat-inducible protein B
MDEFKVTAADMLEKLRKLPLDEIAANLLATLQGTSNLVNSPDVSASIRGITTALESLNKLLANFNGELTPTATEFRKVALQASKTLNQAQEALSMLQPGSPVRVHLGTTLEQAAAAARSLRLLADYLERRPDALIYGKGKRGK